MRTRRGTSLLELMVVVTGCAAMLSISGQLIHRALRSQSQARHCFDGQRTAWRLATDFRRDAHAATAAAVGAECDDQELLRLELPEGRVAVYQRGESSVVRTLTRPDGPEARETYPLPQGVSTEVQYDDASRLATLTIGAEPRAADARPPTTANEAAVNVEIVAQVGRDHRFGAAEGIEEAAP